MRSYLLASGLADMALGLRDRLAIVRSALRQPEIVGAVANDQIARHLLDRLCVPGKTFVDVGAHIGSVAYGVRRRSRAGRIVMVEAIPEKAAALRRNFRWAEVIESAVGDRQGRAIFTIDLDESGYSSLGDVPSSHRVRRIDVAIDRLDALIADHGAIDVIKIDVEGSEGDVLRGADAIVRTARPIILFESVPSTVGNEDKEAIWRWLAERDYELVLPARLAHEGAGLSEAAFLDAHLYPPRAMNYFAVPRERRDEARDRARRIMGIPTAAPSDG